MTRKIYYSATERAFTFSDVHGQKTYMAPDPDWVRPMTTSDDGDDVPDEIAEHPLVEMRNPRILDDAVEVSEADYAALMDAQRNWKLIEPDKNGYPRAVDAPDERLAANWRGKRDAILAETDWTQMPDVPAETREKYATYRQALRDITKQEGFPRNVELPEVPK